MKKIALITGGTGGIGSAVADNLKDKFEIITVARKNATICGDLMDESFRDQLVNDITPYIFINNAGRLYHDPNKMLKMNGNVAVDLLYKFYDRMSEGIIINMSSTSGERIAQPKENISKVSYAIAKKHIKDASLALNYMKEKPIKIMCVSPAAVHTDMLADLYNYTPKEEDYTDYNWNTSVAWMKPKEVAEIIRYLIDLPNHIVIPEIIIDNHYSNAIYW